MNSIHPFFLLLSFLLHTFITETAADFTCPIKTPVLTAFKFYQAHPILSVVKEHLKYKEKRQHNKQSGKAYIIRTARKSSQLKAASNGQRGMKRLSGGCQYLQFREFSRILEYSGVSEFPREAACR